MKKHAAFTIIELIVILVIIGILAVTVAPKLLGKNEFAAVAVRDQIIAQLRLGQLRAMNDRSACYAVRVSSSIIGLYQQANCTGGFVVDSATELEGGVSVSIGTASTTLTTLNILFDGTGRPNGGHCSADSRCTLTVSAGNTAKACFEAEGYVHGC